MALNKIIVAIVAPGGYATNEAALIRAIGVLEAQGCEVRNHYDPALKFQRFGGTDTARIAQLQSAASDPEVQVVIALRGGYGVSRLLPFLDFKMMADSGKLFVGHSDFTAFQMAMLAQTGAVSFAGPMICDDYAREDTSDFTHRNFWACLTQSAHSISWLNPDNPVVEVSGTLWGGNLAMLTHLAGTPYFPAISDGILFIEDINEHPYRIERMLLQLLHTGVLSRQKALLLGDFSGYRLSDYDNGYDFAAMLTFLRSQLSIPVLTGLPFGHTRDKVTLPVGGIGQLTSDGMKLTLGMSGYPCLASRLAVPSEN
jgi:muramoyltetrapeptide carboxypeptidase